jgi:hypothetical protein
MSHTSFYFPAAMSGGLDRYNSVNLGGQQVIGAETTLQVLPGFQVQRSNLSAKFFMGLDAEEHRLWPDDPSNSLRGHMWGMRVATDLWYEPTEKIMATFDASLSTIATNYSARAAFGHRVIDDQFYFGPEIAYFASEGYRHFRLGGHLTGLKTDTSQWSAAGGWARDSDGHSSPQCAAGADAEIVISRGCAGNATPQSSLQSASAQTRRWHRIAGRSATSLSA